MVLHIEFRRQDNPDCAEFVELARSAELEVVDLVRAKRDAPHPGTVVGSGKLDEVALSLSRADADLLLINHEISQGQQRNLEQRLGCRVITRTELILTIFADRARSHEGQLQVELAQLKHAQTRLVRGWTHLDRQKGGIGLRGAGEKQIELDQRMLGDRIKALQQKLTAVEKRRGRSRRSRSRRGTPTVTLVGYTNAGKSTLFNRLADADVYAQDQLFATLDPTARRIHVPGLNDVVLADTVGFVSLLPHALVEAFKATLEEVAQADLLVHVIDAADPQIEERISQVGAVLSDIGAGAVPQVLALNKTDLLTSQALAEVMCRIRDQLAHGSKGKPQVVPVSALSGEGIEQLTACIGAALGVVAPHEVLIESSDGSTRAWLYRSGAVLGESLQEDGRLRLTLQANDQLLDELRKSPRVKLRGEETLPRISA